MKKLVCLMLACLAIPALALGVTEGVVEEAAPVDVTVAAEETVSYLPDASYYAGDDGYEPDWGASETYEEPEFDGECFGPSAQNPGLTSGEIVRAKNLLAMYLNGEAPGDGASVLNVTQNVALGVYPLDPEDYDGEKVFVILPNISLTNGQMLALIDAFYQLGLTFDPEGLNYRNCMRGGGIECTRFFTDEEQARRMTLSDLIRRGILTDVQSEDVLRIELDSRYFNGLDGFSFRPYRSMTDEELAAQLVAAGVRDESEEIDFDAMEKQTRGLLVKEFGCPLSMEFENIGHEGAYTPMTFDDDGTQHYAADARRMSFVSYRYPKAGCEYVSCTVDMDYETGHVVQMSVTDIPIGWVQSEATRDAAVPDAAYIEAANDFVIKNMGGYAAEPAQLAWHVAEGQTWTNYGASVCVSARIEATGEMLMLYVYCGDMQVHGAQLYTDQRGWEEIDFSQPRLPVNG